MAADLEFRCECGQVRGCLRGVSHKNTLRYVCRCDDCQACARHLGRTDSQDRQSGWESFQTAASRLVFSTGMEHLACIILRERLPGRTSRLLRWHAACCNTPIASTYETGKISFLSFYTHGTDPGMRMPCSRPGPDMCG